MRARRGTKRSNGRAPISRGCNRKRRRRRGEPLRRGARRAALAFAAFASFAFGAVPGAHARAAEVVPAPVTSAGMQPDCSLVAQADAASILGYGVLPADRTARAGGVCSYTSAAVSEDGVLSYAFVTPARLAGLRPLFTVLARGCGGGKRTAACTTDFALATVPDAAAYYDVRSAMADAVPVTGVGEEATSADGTLYVRHGRAVIEAVVRRAGNFDLERSERLARLLIARVP